MTTASAELVLTFGGGGIVFIEFGDGALEVVTFAKNDHEWKTVRHNYSAETLHTVTITGEVAGLDCQRNKITSINLSENPVLMSLYCTENQLTDLNVGHLLRLENLSCSSNRLTRLDVSRQTKLNRLNCSNNQLTSLNVSGLTQLDTVSCQYNYMNATALNDFFSSLPANNKGQLYISYNGPDNDGSGTRECDRTIAEKKGWKVLWIPSKITMTTANNVLSLSMSGVDEFMIDYGDGVTEIRTFVEQEWLDINHEYSTGTLHTITIHGEVAGLECGWNKLTSIDLSENSGVESLFCSDNQLTNLDIGHLTNLGNLSCSNNQLTSLDVRKLINLKKLYCRNNRLTSLNVSGLTQLDTVSCQYNYMDAAALNNLFTSLSPSSKNIGLIYVQYNGPNNDGSGTRECDVTIAEKKGWKVLKIPPIIIMTTANAGLSLSMGGEGMVMIDFGDGVTDTKSLVEDEWLDIDYKYSTETLHTITIHGEVAGLDCQKNQLTTLDLSENSGVESLFCSDNQLTNLDISHLTHLGILSCSNNQLTSLNVSKLINLKKLYCSNNRLTSLNVSGLNKLDNLSCQYNFMDAAALDNLFVSLPSSNAIKLLYVSHNGPDYDGSGSKDCDITIAEKKGWIVTWL